MNWYFTPFLKGSWAGTRHFWKHWWCWAPCRIQSGPHGVTTRAGFFEEDKSWGYKLKSHSRQVSLVYGSLGANWSLATWKISVGKYFLMSRSQPNQAEMGDHSGITTQHWCFLCSTKAGWKQFHCPLLLIWYFVLFIGAKYT